MRFFLLTFALILWGAGANTPLLAGDPDPPPPVCSGEEVELIDAVDDDPGVTESILTVEDELVIGTVECFVHIEHTWISDLVITLGSPEGTVNDLFVASGGDADAIEVLFVDGGAPYDSEGWDCMCDVEPFSPMSVFDGEAGDGDWTLTVIDEVSEDTGTLIEWCVAIDEGCPVEELGGFACEVDEKTGDVTLSWFGPEIAADTVNVYRNGKSIGTADPDDGEFTDEEAGPGRHLYAIGHESEEDACEVLTPPCEVILGAFTECSAPDLLIESLGGLFEDTIDITEDDVGGILTAVDVECMVDVTHAFVSDLTIGLTNPDDDTRTTLQSEAGGAGFDILATFSDSGVPIETLGEELTCECLIMPMEGTMADLIAGKASATGPWVIDLEDPFDLDDGTLNEWCITLFGTVEDPPPPKETVWFLRGDCNGDGEHQLIADPIFLFRFGFIPGEPAPLCEEAADCNGDGDVSALPDGIYALNASFVVDAPAIPDPYPDCDEVLEEDLEIGCDDDSGCAPEDKDP